MLDDPSLQSTALARIDTMLGELMKGRIRVQADEHERGWDGMHQRQLFTQQLQAWHEFHEVRIGVGHDGNVNFFHDPKRFEGSTYAELPRDELLAICGTTGLLGKRIESLTLSKGDRDMLVVDLVQRHHRLPGTLRFFINGGTRQVAALHASPTP